MPFQNKGEWILGRPHLSLLQIQGWLAWPQRLLFIIPYFRERYSFDPRGQGAWWSLMSREFRKIESYCHGKDGNLGALTSLSCPGFQCLLPSPFEAVRSDGVYSIWPLELACGQRFPYYSPIGVFSFQ